MNLETFTQQQYIESIAIPLTFCYCVTIVVVAVAILVFLNIRASHTEKMEELASRERMNTGDNQRAIEVAKLECASSSNDDDEE